MLQLCYKYRFASLLQVVSYMFCAITSVHILRLKRVNLVTYEARINTDHTVTAASTLHAIHCLHSGVTWPGITYGHLSALLIHS